MMGHREKLKDGDAYDYIYCRKYLVVRRGTTHTLKQRISRRIRRQTRQQLA